MAIGVLSGLVGRGGAEFRLPVLIGMFRFAALEAVILNKTMTFVVVATAPPFQMKAAPLSDVAAHWPIIANLLVGGLAGAGSGPSLAPPLKSEPLCRVIAVLLLVIACVLLFGNDADAGGQPLIRGLVQAVFGVVAELAIGVGTSLMGVASLELLIPTILILVGVDVKLASSISLAIDLPIMCAGFTR